MARRTLLPTLALAVLAALAPARGVLEAHGASRGAVRPSVDEDGVAPPGRWCVAGGTGARAGTSLSRAVRRTPEVAWTVRLQGELEGEPRVWDGLVYLAVTEGPGRSALHVVELETGRTLAHQVLPATTPLEPAVWDDDVAVRPAEDRIDVYRLRTGRLLSIRTLRATTSISPPIVSRGELYVRVDDTVQRFDPSSREPVWTARVEGAFRGTPAVRGEVVHALWYDAEGNAHLAVLSRVDGRLVSDAAVGHHDGARPDANESASVAMLESATFVRFPRPVRSTTGESFSTGRVTLDRNGRAVGRAALAALATEPIAWDGGWMAMETANGASRWIAARPAPEKGGTEQRTLADASNHAELLAAPVPASRTGDVVYVGGIAADLSTSEVLWKRAPSAVRAVPAAGYLLVSEEPRTVTALREPAPARSDAAAQAAEAARKLEDEAAEAYAALAYQSLRLGDAALTARLVDEAVLRGARGRTVDATRDGLDRLAAARQVTLDPRRLEGVRAQEQAIREKPADALFEQARSARGALQRALLRELLARDAEHAEAVSAVRKLVPASVPWSAEASPRSWLDFLDATEATQVEVRALDAEPADRRDVLARVTSGWSSNLYTYRSDRLYVIAEPTNPGAVARCLEVGELVCDALEGLFGARPNSPRAEPMTLLLYATRETYIEQSRRGGSGPESSFGWTAGHYSPAERISRMFVPGGDGELDELLSIYVHELTHHWLDTRAPFDRSALRSAGLRSAATVPFWIVEGFASMVDEFVFAPRAGTWSPENPRANSLDVVANAAPGQLLDWAHVLTLDHRAFDRLGRDAHTDIPLSWHIGVRSTQSETRLFYAQAAALCHALYATSKPELMRYVEAWYAGRTGELDATRAFDASADELGRRAVANARATVGR